MPTLWRRGVYCFNYVCPFLPPKQIFCPSYFSWELLITLDHWHAASTCGPIPHLQISHLYKTYLQLSDLFIFMPPLKKGAYCFATVGRYVGRSVDQVLSAQYLLTPSLEQYQTWCRGYPQWVVTCSKVKVKSLFRAQCVVCSISFDPFTWTISNLVQRLPSISRWSLSIFRSHVQRSRSNHSFEPSVSSAQYLLTPSLDLYQTWCRGCTHALYI